MCNKYMVSIVVTLVLFFAVATSSIAGSNGKMIFKVISTKNVMKVQGVNGRSMTWKDAKKAKGIIISLQVDVPNDMTLWSTDFNTFYFHENNKDLEDRGRSRAMTLAVSSPDDEGAWIVDDYVKAPVKAGTRYIKILFPLENDVDKVSVHYSYPVVKDIPVNRD